MINKKTFGRWAILFIMLLFLSQIPTKSFASPADSSLKSPAKSQVRQAIEFANQYGWDLSRISFYQSATSGDKLAQKREWKNQILKMAQQIGLPGNDDPFVLVYGEKALIDSQSQLPYTLEFRFWFSKISQKIECAYIAVIPYGNGGYDEERAFARNYVVSQSGIEREMKDYYESNLLSAVDKIAAQDFPLAYKLNNYAANEAFCNLFKQYGFYTEGLAFAYALPSPKKEQKNAGTPYFSAKENEKALLVSTDGKGSKLKIDTNNFFFAERSYHISGTKNRFYIYFCAANDSGAIYSSKEIKQFKSGTRVYPDYCFLMVKPAKPGKNGSLEHFFYPADVSLSTIQSDMAGYFKNVRPKSSPTRPYPL